MNKIKFYAAWLICCVVGYVGGYIGMQMGVPSWISMVASIVASLAISSCLQGAEDQAGLKDQLAEAEMRAKTTALNRQTESSPVLSPVEKPNDNVDCRAGGREPDPGRDRGLWVDRLQQIKEGVQRKPGGG